MRELHIGLSCVGSAHLKDCSVTTLRRLEAARSWAYEERELSRIVCKAGILSLDLVTGAMHYTVTMWHTDRWNANAELSWGRAS